MGRRRGRGLWPRLSDKWRLVSRADIGGGDLNLSWTAEVGLDFRFKAWGNLAFGHKGEVPLGIEPSRVMAGVGLDW